MYNRFGTGLVVASVVVVVVVVVVGAVDNAQFGSLPFHVRFAVQTRTFGSVGKSPSLHWYVACVPTSRSSLE